MCEKLATFLCSPDISVVYNVLSGWKRDCRMLRESNDQERPKYEGRSTCKKAVSHLYITLLIASCISLLGSFYF